jgi:hypothetical protein
LVVKIRSSGALIAKALGQGFSPLSIVNSVSLALTSFFYIYTVGSYFRVSIYILQDRVTYQTVFNTYVINKDLDHIIIAFGIALWLVLSIREKKLKFAVAATYGGLIVIAASANLGILDIIALTSIPIAIFFLLYNRFACEKKILNTYIAINLSVNYLAITGIATGIIGIIISSVTFFPFPSIYIRNYAYEIFVLLSSFSPVLLFLLVMCFPLKLLMNEVTGMLNIKINRIGSLSNNTLNLLTKITCLLFFMLLSVTLVLIPHLTTINKDNRQVGADTAEYLNSIKDISVHSTSVQEFVRQVFVVQSAGDRALTYVLLFAIIKIVPADLSYIIDHLPIVLGPALVLVTYFLTRELTSKKNDITPLLASFLTAISFQMLIGIYAGFYANLLALIIGYLSFVFLFKFLKSPGNKQNFVIFSLLIIILLFSHVYTWSILMIVMGIFLAVMLKLNYYPRRSVILLLLAVLSSVVIDSVRTTFTGISSGIERDLEVAHLGVSLNQFPLRWSNLVNTMQNYFGSQFSNFIIFALVMYWLFRSDLHQAPTIFLVTFLSLGIIPLFFGDLLVQSRVFYNIPFQIPAAIALTCIKRQANGNMIFLAICIWLVDMSIRAVSNFYLILPS